MRSGGDCDIGVFGCNVEEKDVTLFPEAIALTVLEEREEAKKEERRMMKKESIRQYSGSLRKESN